MALKKLTAILIFSVCFVNVFAENGYDLWMGYKKIDDPSLLSSYRAAIRQIILSEKSPILQSAGRELNRGIAGLLQIKPVYEDRITINGTLLIGTPQSQPLIARLPIQAELKNIGDEGYLLRSIIIDGKQSSDAVVFSNHPGENTPNPTGKESSPAYWAGNKLLPRAAQYKNVLICIYNIPADDPLPFSHAYFPCNAFDEVIEKGHWVFGHRDSAYVAIYSQNPVTWQKNTMGRQDELRSTTSQNTWICEMGTQKQWKSFAAFVNKIAASEVNVNAMKVQYHSPSAGLTQFGWTGPLTVNGFGIPLKNYSRFDNPYCKNDFTSNKITINYHHQKLVLDFKKNRRIE